MSTKPISIRLDEKLDARLHHAVQESKLPLADVMRLALSMGLKDLALIDYDIDGAIHDRVLLEKSRQADRTAEPPAALKVADQSLGNESYPSTHAAGAPAKYPVGRIRKKA